MTKEKDTAYYDRKYKKGNVYYKEGDKYKKCNSISRNRSSPCYQSPTKRHNSHKRSSSRRRVQSHRYQMGGMGTLLTMYGQAGGVEESAAQARKAEIDAYNAQLAEINKQLATERNAERKRALEERKKRFQEGLANAKDALRKAQEKMKLLLRGAAETATKAAAALSDGMETAKEKMSEFGQRLSSGAKSLGGKLSSGASSLASKLSSGASSLARKMKESYKDTNYKMDGYTLQRKRSELERQKAKLEQYKRKSPSPSVSSLDPVWSDDQSVTEY